MYAYLADTFTFQPSRHLPGHTLVNWVKSRLDAHRAEQIRRKNLEIVASLDQATLADVGFEPQVYRSGLLQLAEMNPRFIAATAFRR